ncbi:MAG TPA: enoyl-CoA hydratase/isomerase family protein, partial [Clostridia bacterium]|nr:enoyl-CoA hydratase/isomerase family protein [Clostridia bacterium]
MIDRSGCLEWELKDRIGILKISNKPSNMIPKPEFADGKKVMEWLEGNNVSGIILKGDGRHFSAGADLRYFNKTNLSQEEYTNEFNRGNAILNYIENLEKPVIAAIDGACLGGGLEFALACHIRYCSCNAVFGFP